MVMRSGFGAVQSRQRAIRRTVPLLLLGLICRLPAPASAEDCNGRSFERVSVSSAGGQGDQRSLIPHLSSDGCTVAFKSDATNLAGPDHNQATDVLVRDRRGDTTARVSVDANGLEANELSFPPVLSDDGDLVAFASLAGNLIPGDANGQADVFVKNRGDGSIARVTVSYIDPEPDGGSPDIPPAISGDGRWVAFASDATNLVPRDFNEQRDVFVFDRQGAVTELISATQVGADRGYSANGPSTSPVLTADGRFVAFVSKAANLVDGMDRENAKYEIFVWDRQAQTMERITLNSDAKGANADSRTPGIDDSGRFVVFASDASNLVPGDDNGAGDVFVRDRESQLLTRVGALTGCSTGTGGAPQLQPNGFSDAPSISGDARFVAFVSQASNLVDGDSNEAADVFVLERATGLIARITGEDGTQPNGASSFPQISRDGQWIAFQSEASNLVADDSNTAADVFVALNPFLSESPPVTPVPTCTPTATFTEITATPTETPTVTPSATAPPTPTASATAPATSTVTGTPTASASVTRPTVTATVTPPNTTPTSTATAPPTPTGTKKSGGGGGGCSCRVDPRAPSSSTETTLAFAVPVALWLLRRRRTGARA